jgi:hypothetical protein
MRDATCAGMLSPQPDTGPMDAGEGHKETVMTSMTAYDVLMTEHLTRTARVNQRGWIYQATQSTGVASASRTTTVLAPIRQRIGASIVRVGEWLRGAPTGQVANRTVG